MQLEDRLTLAIHAAQDAHATATHNENIAENKYDTLGLEAAYLAHGQSNRIAQYQADLAAFRTLEVIHFTEDMLISVGALIHVKKRDGEVAYFFLGPNSGGVNIDYEGVTIFIITPDAPVGRALLGREVGDEVTIAGTPTAYEILAVL